MMKMQPVFVTVDEDGTPSLIKDGKLKPYYQQVEDGTMLVLRFTPFTEDAQAASGKGGRVEVMTAESTIDDEAPGSENAGGEDPILSWEIDWETV